MHKYTDQCQVAIARLSSPHVHTASNYVSAFQPLRLHAFRNIEYRHIRCRAHRRWHRHRCCPLHHHHTLSHGTVFNGKTVLLIYALGYELIKNIRHTYAPVRINSTFRHAYLCDKLHAHTITARAGRHRTLQKQKTVGRSLEPPFCTTLTSSDQMHVYYA